jgi:hypothetical protein
VYGTNRIYWMVAVVAVVAVASWFLWPSVQDRQLKACVEDIKLSLNDPGSLEVLSTEAKPGDEGAHYLRVEFTAKNKLGGRERASVRCGFKTKNDIVLDPEEYENKLRDIKRTFENAGLRFP